MVRLLSSFKKGYSSWYSVDRIPIVLLLLKEQLSQWETSNKTDLSFRLIDLQQKLMTYGTLYYHWNQMNLNPRQIEWIAEIGLHLQALRQMIDSLSRLSSFNLLPPVGQKELASLPDPLVP